MRAIRGAAGFALFFAALRFVEVMIAPPVPDEPRWLVAAVVTSKFWLAGAALGVIALLGWVSQRLFGWPRPPPPSALQPSREVVPTKETRARAWRFNLVAGWIGFSVLTLIVMADTGTGPFARMAAALFGPNEFIGLETFVLGVPAVVGPVVALALLRWQTRLPLIKGMQKAVKPPPKPRVRRKRP